MPSGNRVSYLDSSALVKLAVAEPQTPALRRYLARRRPLVSSGLARTEVAGALLPLGESAVRRGLDVVSRIDHVITYDDRLTAAAKPSAAPSSPPRSSGSASTNLPDAGVRGLSTRRTARPTWRWVRP